MNKKIFNTLIVGASGIFGKATAKELASANHNLILTYFNKKELSDLKNLADKLNQSFKTKVLIKQLDVRSNSQIQNFIKNCSLPIHNLVYSVSVPLVFKEISKENWDDFDGHWQAQVKGLFYLTNLLVEKDLFLKRIVAIGSIALFDVPPSRLGSYTVAKYALLGFIKNLALHLASRGITVNMISPGLSGTGASKIYPSLMLDLIKKQTPLKRLVEPEDVAYLINFLLSVRADYLTGLNIPLAGGFHMQ